MTREDWIEYFETVNGRKPSEDELAQALSAGEFSEESQDEQTETSQDVSESVEVKETEETTSQPVASEVILPAKKKGLPKKIIAIVAGVVVLLLVAAGVSATVYYSAGDINGDWSNPTLEKEIKSRFEDSTGEEYSKIYKNSAVTLKVKDGKVEASVAVSMDYSDYYSSIAGSFSSFGADLREYLPEYLKSQSAFETYMDEGMADSMKDTKATNYDAKTNTVSATIFKGTVNPWTRTIDVTWVNPDMKSSRDDDSSLSSILFNYGKFKKGVQISYDKEDGQVKLGNDKRGVFVKQ